MQITVIGRYPNSLLITSFFYEGYLNISIINSSHTFEIVYNLKREHTVGVQ